MMPKKRLLYALMIYAYIANSLLLGDFSFDNLTKIATFWLAAFAMWWGAEYFYNKKKSSDECSQWGV